MQNPPNHPSLHIVDHPLVAHKLTHMRNIHTSTRNFRCLLYEIALLMGYEITRELPMTTEAIETPLATIRRAPVIEGKKIAVVPILRAGTGMADGLLNLMPAAPMGHIGLYRDPQTKRSVEYMVRLPSTAQRLFILVDPMLATGNSANHAIDVLNRYGVSDDNIRMMCLVAAPEGINRVYKQHPEVSVYTAALDEKLDEHAYIIPGLGDAGDRLFGTR